MTAKSARATSMEPPRPETNGVLFNPKSSFRVGNASSNGPRARPISTGSSSCFGATNYASLSLIDAEALLRERVRDKYYELKQAFQTYDVDECLEIMPAEFRKVLETHGFALTSEQFQSVLAKVKQTSEKMVCYCDFLDKFSPQSAEKKPMLVHRYERTESAKPDMTTDAIEKELLRKMNLNKKAVLRAFQLFDYNRDGRIQPTEMRRVLDNYCFRMSDEQFDRLWKKHDFKHFGFVNYTEFLKRLGVDVDKQPQYKGKASIKQGSSEEKTSLHIVTTKPRKPIEQVEAEFRQAIEANFESLRKTFIAFDARRDGFITIDDLKTILCQFTFPMSDDVFRELLDRGGFKASVKLPWEHFLLKYQHPTSLSFNGQTLPTKSVHKFNPIREQDAPMKIGDILKLLHEHVMSGFGSLKEAFLKFDYTRRGFITRTELRSVLDKFAFRMSNEQFKELMVVLDPDHSNAIDYQKFLQLFEQKETLGGHKWLDSQHRVNDVVHTEYPWHTVETMLGEKLSEMWPFVKSQIASLDPVEKGRIRKRDMQTIIERYGFYISHEHFLKILDGCKQFTDGTVAYQDVLNKLKVRPNKGDKEGISTRITAENEVSLDMRKDDHLEKMASVDDHAAQHTGGITVDEMILRLKDQMRQHDVSIRDSFVRCANGKNYVTKIQLRKVLESFGFFMTEEQFKQLSEALPFVNGKLTYTDFVHAFEDPREQGSVDALYRHRQNHRVNGIRGDERTFTAEEVSQRLEDKLRQGYTNLRDSFYKFDEDGQGLNRDQFRRMLQSFNLELSDPEFDRLCVRFGLFYGRRMSYMQFLDRFEVRETKEGHKWLESTHRCNGTIEPKQLSAEQVHTSLVAKAHEQWKDLAEAFRNFEASGSGVFRRKDLADVLHRFNLPMSDQEFSKLWKMYDRADKGCLGFQEFLHCLGGQQFAPGDDDGLSKRIINDSHNSVVKHLENQRQKQDAITCNQAVRTKWMSADEVVGFLRAHIQDHYQDMFSAFQRQDSGNSGCLSLSDIRGVLLQHNIYVDNEQMFQVLDRIGLKTHQSKLSYEQFLRAFSLAEYVDEKAQRSKDRVVADAYPALSPAHAEARVQELAARDAEMLRKAFQSFDKQRSGQVKTAEFRRVLDSFCFKLTETQFKHLLKSIGASPSNVPYTFFLERCGATAAKAPAAQVELPGVVPPAEKPKADSTIVSVIALQEKLYQMVPKQCTLLAADFEKTDYANIGVVSQEDFKKILFTHCFTISDDLFGQLWSTLPVNNFNNMEYGTFLRIYSGSSTLPMAQRPPSSMGEPRPRTTFLRPQTAVSSRMAETEPMVQPRPCQTAARRPMTASAGSKDPDFERLLRTTVYRRWKEIRRQCETHDPHKTHEVHLEQMTAILNNFGLEAHVSDVSQVTSRYNLLRGNAINYTAFLRHFILTLKPSEEGLLSRQKLPRPRVSTTMGEPTPHLLAVMLQLRDVILGQWKPIRRGFRAQDPEGSGVLSPAAFRRVLSDFSINLSEDQFYHLMAYYDGGLTGKVSYNDFLRAFLN